MPDLEDAEGITIQGKNQEGAYNTQETPLSPGEKISLTAIYGNPACISKPVWESGNKYMLDVDAFGVVSVKRGGTQPYYTVKASVESLDGGVYTDEIKIYVKSKANISSMAELSWYGSQFFYGAPAKAFDGIVGVFGNWLQAMDGIAVYSVKCDFKQQIKFGEMKIHIGVNAPVSILVKAYKLDGTMQELANYTNITINTTLTIDQVGEYSAFEYVIEEASSPCTIYEIEIFNHDDFPLSNIQQTTVPEQRGPGGRGYYDPIISQPTEIVENTYGQKFEKENSPLIFSYSTFEPMILIGAILGAGSIAIIVVMVFTVLKKERR